MINISFLIVLFICHWLADYTHLSTAWMLDAKRLGTPLRPIFAHAAVHALLMSIASACFGFELPFIFNLFAFQLVTHFAIDVWKGKMNVWFPTLQNPANKLHWYIFGFDQLLHALVIIAIYYFSCIL